MLYETTQGDSQPVGHQTIVGIAATVTIHNYGYWPQANGQSHQALKAQIRQELERAHDAEKTNLHAQLDQVQIPLNACDDSYLTALAENQRLVDELQKLDTNLPQKRLQHAVALLAIGEKNLKDQVKLAAHVRFCVVKLLSRKAAGPTRWRIMNAPRGWTAVKISLRRRPKYCCGWVALIRLSQLKRTSGRLSRKSMTATSYNMLSV